MDLRSQLRFRPSMSPPAASKFDPHPPSSHPPFPPSKIPCRVDLALIVWPLGFKRHRFQVPQAPPSLELVSSRANSGAV